MQKRQRLTSAVNVSATPPGQTFMPRLEIISSDIPSPQLGRESFDRIGPGQKHVSSDHLALFVGADVGRPNGEGTPRSSAIVDCLERLRFLPQTSHHSLSKLFRPYILFGNAFFEDIVSLDSIFNGLEPSVVGAFSHLSLVNVDQHLDCSEEESRRVGQILTCAPRSRTVNRFEHRAAMAKVGTAGQTERVCDVSGNVGENVAIEVRHYHHIKRLWRVGQLGSSYVDKLVLVFVSRVLVLLVLPQKLHIHLRMFGPDKRIVA